MYIKKYFENNIKIRFIYLYIKQLFYIFKFNSINKKEKYIKRKFKRKLGYEIDFSKDPVTFNQKIQFRKLYDNNPLYAICADKYRVREYVKKKIGEEYLIPLYLVTDKLTMEQWEELPESFVAKANHNSGPVQIVKDKSKVDAKKIIKELNSQLKIDYGVLSMEKWYSNISRKIIVEEFIGDKSIVPADYKFHCFKQNDNSVIYIEYITGRTAEELGSYNNCYYNENWEKQNFNLESATINAETQKPKNYSLMLNIVKKLSADFDYVRVDLYNFNGKIYFGELTFADGSGMAKFYPEIWDYKFGEFWNQPKLK